MTCDWLAPASPQMAIVPSLGILGFGFALACLELQKLQPTPVPHFHINFPSCYHSSLTSDNARNEASFIGLEYRYSLDASPANIATNALVLRLSLRHHTDPDPVPLSL